MIYVTIVIHHSHIFKDKPSKPIITGDLNVEVNQYVKLTCSSQSTAATDYTWFVNDTKINEETRETLILCVTRNHKYNRYLCTATEEGLVSDRSDPVQINPLCKYDRSN